MVFDFSLLNSSVDGGFIIGKAQKFFTLYQYECRKKVDEFNGKTYYNFNAHWVRNIGKDIEKVKELFPNCQINEELHGRFIGLTSKGNGEIEKTPYYAPKYDYRSEVFKFGKYSRKPICECTDEGYLCWMLNPKLSYTISGEPFEKYVLDSVRDEFTILACIDRLTELGGKFVLGRYVTSSDENVEKAISLVEDARLGKPLTINITSNIDGIGNLNNVFGVDLSICFEFFGEKPASKVVNSRYSRYGMLKCSDGKFHKVVGKTVTINNYRLIEGDGAFIIVKSSDDYVVC